MIPPISDLNQKTAAPLPKNGSAGATTGTTKALNAEVSQLLAGDNGTPRNWRGPLLVLPAIYALVGLVLRSGQRRRRGDDQGQRGSTRGRPKGHRGRH